MTGPYTWRNVRIGGGGFVDGIVFHPTARGVRYCRTDMGGAYRWNDRVGLWEPLLDWVSPEDWNLMGVESIALDPNDPDRLYLACGTYARPYAPNAVILRSNDRGRAFQRVDVPFKMGGNENGRGNGERMAVDPCDGDILYFGSRHAGLWRSADRAATWERVETFPDVSEDEMDHNVPGIVFVVFDPRSGSRGRPRSTIYVGVSLMGRNNLFRSTDGGAAWEPVPGHPTQYRPNHAMLASDGTLYVSYGDAAGPGRMKDGGVWKLDTDTGRWTDITPDKPDPNEKNRSFGYAAVAVDPRNPRTAIASSFRRRNEAGGEEIFRSIDGGATWKPIFASGSRFDYSLAPYTARTPVHWMFDVEIDPADPDHAMFTTGYGGYETFNLTDMDRGKPTKWSVMSAGIEQTVALDLLSPPQGAHLISAIGDYAGFVHWDLEESPPEGHFDYPRFSHTDSLACAENRPEIVVRVGRAGRGQTSIAFSLDGGRTWRPAGQPSPDCRGGHVAVSSDGTAWIWTPLQSLPHLSRDRGATWLPCGGLTTGTRVVADRVAPETFYAMNLFEGRFFVSSDAGTSFVERPLSLPGGLPRKDSNRGDPRGGQDRLYAAPGRKGDLWLAAFDGLYRSANGGESFDRLDGVSEIRAFGFGAPAPGAEYPTLYLVGVVKGVQGVFRSDDVVRDWRRINDDRHQWGSILHVTGDPKRWGRVYVGTHGRGILYGDPTGSTN
ncbi:exo-alpha-sialidase [Candidatus Sumerlaeota bacterium]|nr:exo-alpha-sialidase [Candidatus Sumerlaeota bacterium]